MKCTQVCLHCWDMAQISASSIFVKLNNTQLSIKDIAHIAEMPDRGAERELHCQDRAGHARRPQGSHCRAVLQVTSWNLINVLCQRVLQSCPAWPSSASLAYLARMLE